VLGFGPDVRVEAPEELRDHVQRLHREAAEGLEGSGRR
jgi:predicted DNA-binding transcriptional regulator YafY